MKITAGKRGDAAREAKDRAENKFYWDSFNRGQVLPKIKKDQEERINAAVADIRRQIDRLISDGYAKQVFEDDVSIYIDTGYGNKTMSARSKYLDSKEGTISRRYNFSDECPEQIKVRVQTKRGVPYEWNWRAYFEYEFGKNLSDEGKYELKSDVSTYSFNSSDPADIEYFAACGEILKALSKVNWNKILTTNPYEGMEELYKQLPDKPDASVLIPEGAIDKYGKPVYSKYNDKIKRADIEDALEEWKKGEKWLYVGTRRYYNDAYSDPIYDDVTGLMAENGFRPGWYRYIGETDKYYKVEFMSYRPGKRRLAEGLPPEQDKDQWKDKVRKDDFEYSIYYPITWYGKA